MTLTNCEISFGWPEKMNIDRDLPQKVIFTILKNLRGLGFWSGGYDTTLFFFQIMSIKNLLNSPTNVILSFIWKVCMCECGDLGSRWPKKAQIGHC